VVLELAAKPAIFLPDRYKPADFIRLPQQAQPGQGISTGGYPELDALPVMRYFRNRITDTIHRMDAG